MSNARLGKAIEIFRDMRAIYHKLSRRRKRQLGALLVLQVLGGVSEVLGISAAFPFLAALATPYDLLERPELKPLFLLVGVREREGLITLMAIVFGVTIVLVNGLRMLILWVQTRLGGAIGSDLSIEVYRRTLHQTYEFHTKMNSSKLISVITNDFRAMMADIHNVLMMVTHGLVVVSIFIALMSFSAQSALIMGAVTLGAYALVVKVSKARLVRNSQRGSDMYILTVKALQEGLGGIRDILLDNSQHIFVQLYSQADRPMRRAGADTQVVRSIPRYIIEAIAIVSLSVVAVVLAWNKEYFRSVLPIIGGLTIAASRLFPAVQQVYASFAGMQGSHVSLKRTLAALERPLDPISVVKPEDFRHLEQGIKLEGVWFRYGKASPVEEEPDWVLKDINLEIPAKKTIALVGRTGGGKSTVADIVLGLLRPQKGNIRVDGMILTDEELATWRRSVAHVPQSIYLSDASVKENIAFGVPVDQIDMARVEEVAHLARISDFIEDRRAGYDGIIGERGIRLSGGQRQRIGIARALYKRASVIIFDEATSSLDITTEEEVMDAINNLSGRMTLMLIAHRLSTVRNADMIFEIQRSRVVASGTYEELITNSDTFRAMAHGAESRG